ncbi:TipAS antibiotic-recognition domain-containing protein [Brevibacillus composti]|uniref:TipAS antibiotic-recognition domain-containing protein n=1 Tax=Brevibacillus composti TaxID=2796470 RepID=A0A7T5JMV1_9BACL|nr:TipAS antibiotic-recognition domain-containing protein [Brevibacillus composti]QQE73499.1 TipAS antibiotic-recognition domain-containing protein [Brevibacillus composti]QUO40581.1 TipAS antibiotic-recognition domain-containing protein [Brevibacillus composti]
MREQNEHLKQAYDFDLLESVQIDSEAMNEMASQAAVFMSEMGRALKAGVKHTDEHVFDAIRSHLAFLNQQGHSLSAADFALQTRFFLEDDFHLRMLEGQQTGLAYYLAAAADAYASS